MNRWRSWHPDLTLIFLLDCEMLCNAQWHVLSIRSSISSLLRQMHLFRRNDMIFSHPGPSITPIESTKLSYLVVLLARHHKLTLKLNSNWQHLKFNHSSHFSRSAVSYAHSVMWLCKIDNLCWCELFSD